MDYLSSDLIQSVASYLDADSAISLSRVSVAINQHCLPPDSEFWRSALLNLPPHVRDTATLLATSKKVHAHNLRGIVASLSKPGNFSKVKKLKERERLLKLAKPLIPKNKSTLARLLGTAAAEAALLRADRAEAVRVLRESLSSLPAHAQRRLRESAILRKLFPDELAKYFIRSSIKSEDGISSKLKSGCFESDSSACCELRGCKGSHGGDAFEPRS